MKLTNKLDLPSAFLEMAQSDYEYKPKRYSATQMTKGYKEILLKRRHYDEIEKDVADMIWLLFGTAVHYILEQAEKKEGELKEEKLATKIIDDYKLSGKFDLFQNNNNKVIDYKTSSIWKVIYGDYDDWYKQTLIYAYLLKQKGYTVNQGEIVALLKDWKKSKANYKKSYPQQAVKVITFDFDEKDYEFVEEYLTNKFNKIIEYEKLPDDEIPVCTPEERWRQGDEWAVKKKNRKRACRVLDSEEDAVEWMDNNKGDYIEYRPGIDRKCRDYCDAAEFCNYYKENVEE